MQDAPKILVVDDEPKICEFIETFLGREGYLAESALSGADALKKLQSREYHLVISDLKMPGMDGFELARRVKELRYDLPLVIVTGYATMGTAIEALRRGVDDYVTKPFKIDEMRKVISRVLEKARLANENRRLLAELAAANEQLKQHRETLKDRIRLANEDLRQRLQELTMLYEVAVCAASELDLDKLLNNCVRIVSEKLDVTRASVMLRDGEKICVRACKGDDGQDIVGRTEQIGNGVAGLVAATGKPILVPDIASDARFVQQVGRGYRTRSLACVPIIYNQEVLGVVCVTDKRTSDTFVEADLRLLNTIASQVASAIENARLYRKLEESAFATVRALVAALEAKDRYTSGHSMRVTRYALEIAAAMGIQEKDKLVLDRACQLHDLGKLGVSDVILNKPGTLTPAEYEVIKQHPELGEQIIEPLHFLKDVRPAIRHHHERPDGLGYPDGKCGDEINLLSRIMSVADAFDAMTTPRPYRPAKGVDKAVSEITSLRSRQFDAGIVMLFCDEVLSHRLRDSLQT